MGNNFWMKFGYFGHCAVDCCSLIGCQPAEVQHGHNPDTLWANKDKFSSLDPTTNSETRNLNFQEFFDQWKQFLLFVCYLAYSSITIRLEKKCGSSVSGFAVSELVVGSG